MSDLGGLVGTVIVDVEPGSDKFLADVRRMSSSAGESISTHLGRATRTVLGDITDTAAGFGAVFAGITTAAAGLGIKTSAELEVANLQFVTLLGSAEKAEDRVASLFQFAKTTPFETQPIIDASRLLQTFGGDALAAEENLTLVGDAAAATNTEISDVAFWVGRAYAAIQGGQPFGEAAARLQELAILTPKARAEMERLQKSGADASEIYAVLTGELDRFDGAMEKQAGTLGGLTSTLSDIASLTAAGVFKPLFEETKEGLGALTAFAETPAFDRITDRLTNIVERATDTDLAGGLSGFLDRLDVRDVDRFFDRIDKGLDTLSDLRGELGGLTGIAAGAGAALGSMALRNIPLLGGLAPAISPVTGILGGLVFGSDKGREALRGLGDEFGVVAQRHGPAALDALGKLTDAVGDGLGSAIAEVGPELADAADRVLPIVTDLVSDLAPQLGDLVEEGGHLVAEVLPVMVDLFEAGVPLLQLAGPATSLLADALGVVADNADIAVPLLVTWITAMKAKSTIDSITRLAGGARGLGDSLTGLTSGAKGAATAAGVAVGAWALWNTTMGEAKRRGEEAADAAFGAFDPAATSAKELDGIITGLQSDLAGINADLAGSSAPWDADYRAELKASRSEGEKFLANLVDQRDRTEDLAEALDIDRDAARRLVVMQGELGDEFGTTTHLAETFRTELDKLTRSSTLAADAHVGHEEAIDALAESLKANGDEFRITEQAGRDNVRALQSTRDAALEVAAAMIEQSGDVDGARRFMADYTDGLVATLEQAGLTKDEIDKLLDTYGLSPAKIETAIDVVGAEQAAGRVSDLHEKLEGLPESEVVAIEALIDDGKFAEAERRIAQLTRPRFFDILGNIRFAAEGFAPLVVDVVNEVLAKSGTKEAAGGILDFYAGGGMRESHIAQLAPAGMTRVWNEPETGGEAYIPLANDWRRPRARDVWEETGRRLGIDAGPGMLGNLVHVENLTVQQLPGEDAGDATLRGLRRASWVAN